MAMRRRTLWAFVPLFFIGAIKGNAQTAATQAEQVYENRDTRELVALVDDAAKLVQTKGETVFADFRASGGRWRQGETYVFVLDPDGNMVVHPDSTLEGKNQLELKDINGKPIIRGLLAAAMTIPASTTCWVVAR
jgi:signal transduction histidine kinase